jgi:hypothetical protein
MEIETNDLYLQKALNDDITYYRLVRKTIRGRKDQPLFPISIKRYSTSETRIS